MKLSKKLPASLPRHDICMGSNLEKQVAIVFFLNHLQTVGVQAYTNYAQIVERHVLCAQSPIHLAESAAPTAAVGCSLQ